MVHEGLKRWRRAIWYDKQKKEFEHKQISLEARGYHHSPRSKPRSAAIIIFRAENRGQRLSPKSVLKNIFQRLSP